MNMELSKESAAPVSLEELFNGKNVRVGTTMTGSLFRNRKSGKVVYLEAGKDFADALLSLLLLPVGTVIHLLSKGIHVKPPLGGFVNFYESVQRLDTSDLQVAKDKLVRPRPAAIECSCSSVGLNMQAALETVGIIPTPIPKPAALAGDYYACNGCRALFHTVQESACKHCDPEGPRRYYSICDGGPYTVTRKSDPHDPSIAGLVPTGTKYIVTDNLEIMRLTTNNSVSVLNRMKNSSITDLEVIDITITITQVLQLFQSALNSETCLTDVFGQKK